ncbi:MAG: hypothetical protein IJ875_07065 [Solobacterium sp.]|nr:hypothetical protein [Solobacterium sp.]
MENKRYFIEVSGAVLGILFIVFGQYIAPMIMKGNMLAVVSNVTFYLGVVICVIWLIRCATKRRDNKTGY